MVVLTIAVTSRIVNLMISGKMLAAQLEKFLKSPVCQNARVQVKLPQGEFRSPDGYFDVLSVSLVENNILMQRETHRIVIEIAPQTWKMGKPKLKL